DSLRGGYGIYYGLMGTSTIYNTLINTAMPGGQFQVSLNQTAGPSFPNTLATQPSNSTVNVQFFQPGFKLPRIHQAAVTYEHEITRNTVISGSLLLSFGHRLPLFVDTNISPPNRSFTYTISGGPFDGQNYTVPWFYGCGVAATCGSSNGRPNPNFGAMTSIETIGWT